jgi:hypothetical protein
MNFPDPSNDKEPELHICLEIAQPKSKGVAFRPSASRRFDSRDKGRSGTIVDTSA